MWWSTGSWAAFPSLGVEAGFLIAWCITITTAWHSIAPQCNSQEGRKEGDGKQPKSYNSNKESRLASRRPVGYWLKWWCSSCCFCKMSPITSHQPTVCVCVSVQLITSPSEEHKMYVQQRDEFLESVCDMAIRKISIITIFGSLTNSTMKIDHYQLGQHLPHAARFLFINGSLFFWNTRICAIVMYLVFVKQHVLFRCWGSLIRLRSQKCYV